jgi:excisionase family DNA binding protein
MSIQDEVDTSMTTTTDPIALSIAEAAACAGLSRSLLYERIAAGELPIAHVGRRTLILVDDLRAFLERHRVGQEESPKRPSGRGKP